MMLVPGSRMDSRGRGGSGGERKRAGEEDRGMRIQDGLTTGDEMAMPAWRLWPPVMSVRLDTYFGPLRMRKR